MSAASISADTEPLPLVPATCTARNVFCGSPRRAAKSSIGSRPTRMVLRGRRSQSVSLSSRAITSASLGFSAIIDILGDIFTRDNGRTAEEKAPAPYFAHVKRLTSLSQNRVPDFCITRNSRPTIFSEAGIDDEFREALSVSSPAMRPPRRYSPRGLSGTPACGGYRHYGRRRWKARNRRKAPLKVVSPLSGPSRKGDDSHQAAGNVSGHGIAAARRKEMTVIKMPKTLAQSR